MTCWKCGKSIELEFVSRSDECPSCRADLRSCRNCKFYLPGSRYDCHETIDELVKDKERANFCGSFAAGPNPAASPASRKSDAGDAKKKFDALFSL